MDTLKKKPKTQRFDQLTISDDHQRAADYDWAIGLNRKLLKTLGLWSYSEESRWQNIRSNLQTIFFCVGILSFVTFPQTLALIRVRGRLNLIVDNLVANVPATTAILKIMIQWFKKKVLANIFKEIESDYRLIERKTKQERDVMVKYATMARTITIFGAFSGFFVIAFGFAPLLFGISPRTITNLTDKPGSLFTLQTVYLYDISIPCWYYLALMSQILGCSLAIGAYTGIDVLFGTIILHACGQLENLANRIQRIVDENPQNYQQLLKINIQCHYRLIGFVNTIEQVFSLMLLAMFGSVAIIFCIIGFQLVTAFLDDTMNVPLSHNLFYLQYLGYYFFLMFVYAWVGEYLVTQSEAIHTAVYNCNWISLDPKDVTSVILLLLRSHYPLHITAGKLVPLTLKTFASLVKTSVGYISFLLAVKE